MVRRKLFNSRATFPITLDIHGLDRACCTNVAHKHKTEVITTIDLNLTPPCLMHGTLHVYGSCIEKFKVIYSSGDLDLIFELIRGAYIPLVRDRDDATSINTDFSQDGWAMLKCGRRGLHQPPLSLGRAEVCGRGGLHQPPLSLGRASFG